MGKNLTKESWISLILRMAMVSLFAMAAIGKFMGGLDGVVANITGMFKSTWLPEPLVALYARSIAFVEAIIAIWLFLGIRLKEAWAFTALTLISLAFGLLVAQQGTMAASVYIYILIACVGLYFSEHDRCNVSGWIKK